MDFGDFANISKELAENAKIKEAVKHPKHYQGIKGLEVFTVMENFIWDSKDEQYKLKSLELGSSDLFHQFGYFKNQEDCKRAIDLFGDEIKELFVEGDA